MITPSQTPCRIGIYDYFPISGFMRFQRHGSGIRLCPAFS
jgi:hypothetical protein